MKNINTFELAECVLRRHVATHPLGHYTGILTLNGLGYLALSADNNTDRTRLLDFAQQLYSPFIKGNRSFKCNFPNYLCGGNGAAYLWLNGELPEASEETFIPYVDELLNEAPRDRNGILCHIHEREAERIWIDVVFAVSPFLLYCGLKLNRDDLVRQAWEETRKYIEILTVPETGCIHQAINFRGPGHKTGDHWSRGNGWAIHALAALVKDLPADHEVRPDAEKAFVSLVDACIRLRDEKTGLWYQEMTAPESYIETSGSGLILHAIGVGIEKKILDESYLEVFNKGIKSLLSYIGMDGSVHNTCIGCLSPNQGTRQDYIERRHQLNDHHAFGPIVFAYAQAWRLGIKEISPVDAPLAENLK